MECPSWAVQATFKKGARKRKGEGTEQEWLSGWEGGTIPMVLEVLKNWGGVLIGALGVIVGVALQRSSRIHPRPAYQTFSMVLIRQMNGLPAEVKVLYKGELVERVTKSYVVFWNEGTGTIRGADVVETDPIAIEIDYGTILDLRVLKATRDVIGFRIAEDNVCPSSKVACVFDFMDRGDGILIELLHTSVDRHPKVRGTIRGIPEGIVDCGQLAIDASPKTLQGKVIALITLILIAFTAASLVFSQAAPGYDRHYQLRLLLLSAVFAMNSLLLWETKSKRHRFPKALLVDELRGKWEKKVFHAYGRT